MRFIVEGKMSLFVMPVAGLTYLDVSAAALECGGNRVRTAKRLGVAVRSLDYAIERSGLHNWFVSGHGRGRRFRQTCITAEQVVAVRDEGWLRADAADMLGISISYLTDLSRRWKVRWDLDRGRSIRIGQKGYCS